MLYFSQNHTYLPDRFKSNFLFHSLVPQKQPIVTQLAFWCFYNRNKKNTVEMRWVKSVEYVRIYNAINSEQPATKANVYPLPVVLLASPARELCFWLSLTVPIAELVYDSCVVSGILTRLKTATSSGPEGSKCPINDDRYLSCSR